MIFAFIGWAALALASIWCAGCGFWLIRATLGFTGRFSWLGLIFLSIACVGFYVMWAYGPLAVMTRGAA